MKKAKIIIIILVILAAIIGIYLNRTYAYIYSRFELTKAPLETIYMTEKPLLEKATPITYVAIGDSLTAGVGASSVSSSLPALLAEKLKTQNGTQVSVKNLGMPGATSLSLVTKSILDLSQYNPQIVTIFIGTNDVHNFVPLDVFKTNLLTVVNSIKQTTKAEIYLINIPYLGAADLVFPPYDVYFEAQLQQYNMVVDEVAQETNVTLIDIYSASKKPLHADPQLYSIDRFHPSDSGYALWANLIYGYFK